MGTFTFVVYRLQAPPFDLGLSASSLVFLLWVTGIIGPFAGRLAERLGWRRLVTGAIVLSTAGTLVTLPDHLSTLVVGLACIAAAMFTGYTASMLGVGAVAHTDRGAASAFFFCGYYVSGALGAYLPGIAWERASWHGVIACTLSALAVAGVAAAVIARRERPRALPSSA